VDPDQAVIDQAKVTAYQRWLAADRGVGIKDYGELWRWSAEDLAAFWSSIRDYFGVLGAIWSPCSADFGCPA
jgi:acetoacetyl-CoA synthetase